MIRIRVREAKVRGTVTPLGELNPHSGGGWPGKAERMCAVWDLKVEKRQANRDEDVGMEREGKSVIEREASKCKGQRSSRIYIWSHYK